MLGSLETRGITTTAGIDLRPEQRDPGTLKRTTSYCLSGQSISFLVLVATDVSVMDCNVLAFQMVYNVLGFSTDWFDVGAADLASALHLPDDTFRVAAGFNSSAVDIVSDVLQSFNEAVILSLVAANEMAE